MLTNYKNTVKRLKKQSLVLYFACTDSRLPLWKKIFVSLVIGYLFSPIDLIPDFIPVIGYLDDLIIVPIGIYISLRLIPSEILEDSKKRIEEEEIQQIPVGRKTALLIVLIWIVGLSLVLIFLLRLISKTIL